MKKHSLFTLAVFALMTALLSAQVVYDASAGDPNPATQGWITAETILVGDANVAPVTVGGQPAWRIDDRRTEGSLNNPAYRVEMSPAEIQGLFDKGWEFTYTFSVPQITNSGGFSAFCGWGVRAEDAPEGWNVPSGKYARVGFLLGSRSSNSFFVTQQGREELTFSEDPNALHTVRVVGEAGSDYYEWFVDGVSQGSGQLADFQFTSTATPRVQFEAGASSALNGMSDWTHVSLKERRLPNVVIDTDTLTITDGGVASSDTFRGVPFTATVYNGLARFLFAGDLTFDAADLVVGKGAAAISFTVSGDVTIPDGAVFDISARPDQAGPGGGTGGSAVSGGDAGKGKTGGGSAGGGGGGEGQKFDTTTSGERGDPGKTKDNGTTGETGDNGSPGRAGGSGFRSENSGGVFVSNSQTGRGGTGGGGGNKSTSPGGGGAGGPTGVIGRNPGSPGKDATANGVAGRPGNPGGRGVDAGSGSAQSNEERHC